MGKVTGFLEYTRETAATASGGRAHQRLVRNLSAVPRRERAHPGRALHGLRRALLPHRLPAHQPDSRLERPGLSRAAGAKPSRQLHATNNFPEFTGRICPAPCEAACVLGINEPPVTIKHIEKTIVDRAFAEGLIHAGAAAHTTGKRVAVVGSGPAGLAAAQQLARAGHDVTVFEKADRIGGLLRYGIPNFKMEKHLIDRRLEQMRAEGVKFHDQRACGRAMCRWKTCGSNFDAILLAGGAEQPRDLNVPGRELNGIHFAMDFLPQQNQRCEGDTVSADRRRFWPPASAW